MDLRIMSLLAGLFFGIWPLCMQKSGLDGNVSAAVFSAVVLAVVSPFAFREFSGIGNVKWVFVIAAGSFGAIGIMCFNGMLAKATPQNVGMLCVLMVVVQMLVPAVYSVIMGGGISTQKAIGVILAVVAGILITRG